MPETGGPLSATRWNARMDRLLRDAREQAERLHNMFYEDGHPPFTQPKPPEEQYMALAELFWAGDPQVINSPQALDALKKLAQQLGAPFPPPMPAAQVQPVGAPPLIPGPPPEAPPFPVPPPGGPTFGVV